MISSKFSKRVGWMKQVMCDSLQIKEMIIEVKKKIK